MCVNGCVTAVVEGQAAVLGGARGMWAAWGWWDGWGSTGASRLLLQLLQFSNGGCHQTLLSLTHPTVFLPSLPPQRPSAIYKRYKLSEEKSFASFFHPDKQAILGLVDQFLNKTGKFGIPGYPQASAAGCGGPAWLSTCCV